MSRGSYGAGGDYYDDGPPMISVPGMYGQGHRDPYLDDSGYGPPQRFSSMMPPSGGAHDTFDDDLMPPMIHVPSAYGNPRGRPPPPQAPYYDDVPGGYGSHSGRLDYPGGGGNLRELEDEPGFYDGEELAPPMLSIPRNPPTYGYHEDPYAYGDTQHSSYNSYDGYSHVQQGHPYNDRHGPSGYGGGGYPDDRDARGGGDYPYQEEQGSNRYGYRGGTGGGGGGGASRRHGGMSGSGYHGSASEYDHAPLIGIPEDRPSAQTDFPKLDDVGVRVGGRVDFSLDVPKHDIPDWVTASGTYRDGDIAVNRKGYRSGENDKTNEEDGLSLQDLEIIKVLGKGASAVVQLAVHKITREKFALKDMQLSVDETVRLQIRNELKINHRTQSKHIVHCHQSFFSDGHMYILLEYMDGGSLADLVEKHGRIGEQYLAQISRKALLGLQALHDEYRIIHRDIKPSNLLLNHKGEIKISDFGVSRVLEDSCDCGKTFAGTCTYMSPERINGGKYSFGSDIWALGLSILECALGRFPYQPPAKEQWNNYFQLLSTICNQPAPKAPNDEFSEEFCSFIELSLKKNPAERTTAAELLKHPFVNLFGNDVDIRDLF